MPAHQPGERVDLGGERGPARASWVEKEGIRVGGITFPGE